MDRYDPYTDKFIKDATDKNVGTKYDELEIVRAISGLTEWQKHVQTDSNIDRDITVAIEALKTQLGTNLAEVGTRAVRGYPIDADALMERVAEEYGERARDTLYRIIRYMPPAQPKTATMTVGRTKGEITMWYECDNCGEPVDQSDNYCRNCGRKFRRNE